MDNNQFSNAFKSASERILERLHDNFGDDDFKAYFYGDPIAIPISQLPCIIVDTQTTNSELGPTGMDRVIKTIMVSVVLNKRDDFNGDTSVSVTKKKLEMYMEARDATTQQYVPESVMGILRTYLTLAEPNQTQNLLVNSVSDIKYGVTNRSSTGINTGVEYDTLAAEAMVTFTTTELIRVDNRQ